MYTKLELKKIVKKIANAFIEDIPLLEIDYPDWLPDVVKIALDNYGNPPEK